MKLASELLLYELLTQCLPGLDHERNTLGPPLLDPRLPPTGACRIHHQRHEWHARTWRAAPAQGIKAADPLHPGVLACRRGPHDHAYEVVDEGEHHPLRQHARHRLAMPHVHRHRGLEVRSRGFDLPALSVELSEVGHTIDCRVEACRHQGDLAGPEAWRVDVGAHLAAC